MKKLLYLFLFVTSIAHAQEGSKYRQQRIFPVPFFKNGTADGIRILDGAMTSGTHTFTSATANFTSADIGKFIRVPFPAGDLVTTITAVGSSTSVTLAGSTASSTVSADTCIYGTDNTAAIQAAINACGIAGGGTVWFPTGKVLVNGDNAMYIVAGACQTAIGVGGTINPNSQIYFPVSGFVDFGGANFRTSYVVEGETGPEFTPALVSGDSLVPHTGTIIYSLIDGSVNNSTPPSVFGLKATSGGFGPFNYNYPTFKNLTILTAANAANGGTTMTGINGYWSASLVTDNVLVACDHSIAARPIPSVEAAGIIFNAQGTESMAKCKDTWVSGYYYGVVAGENTNLDNAGILGNLYGLVICRNQIAVYGSKLSVNFCTNSLYSPNASILGGMIPAGTGYVNISLFDCEITVGGTGWWKNTLLVTDVGNHLIGNINYSLTTGSGHTSSAWNISGGTGLQATAIDIPQWAGSPASIPTSLTSNVPIVINSTVSDGIKLITANAGQRGNYFGQNTSNTGYFSNILNDEGAAFAGGYGGLYFGNSLTNVLSLFGTNGREWLFLTGNGSLAGMGIGPQTNVPLIFGSNGIERGRLFGGGNWSFGTTSDNGANVNFSASTTTRASFNVASGTGPTTMNNGDMYSDGSNWFFKLGTVKYAIPKSLAGSATLDFPSTGVGAVADLTITVTGAAVGDPVLLGVPNASITTTATFWAWVSATNTVTVRFSPKTTEDPASGTFKVTVTPQ